MVFVKVRETYDLHTVRNKLTLIGIHTPDAKIIQRNYPGLLMQCKFMRPVSCDVRVACASMLPADPLQVSTTEGDIAPEDLFNPILYKACSNHGMSQIEARMNAMGPSQAEAVGASAFVDNDSAVSGADDFNLYYALLSDTHQWRHANPQSGLEMHGLKPLVYEMLYSVGDNNGADSSTYSYPTAEGAAASGSVVAFRGNAKPMPFINCTSFSDTKVVPGFSISASAGSIPANAETAVYIPRVFCGQIIVPPSRLHQLFYRMVIEWTIEFSAIRSIGEITDWVGLASGVGANTHFMSYDYGNVSKALGVEESVMDNETSMVSSNVDIEKVM